MTAGPGSPVGPLLRAGVAVLGERADAPAEARTLLAHVLKVEPNRLPLVDEVDETTAAAYRELLERRATGVPLQHLTGVAYFRTVGVRVGPGVFIPRPETEVMTGWAIERLRELHAHGLARPRVVELCAGSGAISLAIATEVAGCEQYAVELAEDAVGWAQANLAGTDVVVQHGDMAEAFPELDGRCDLVIANPPYVPLEAYEGVPEEVRRHDPAEALFSGLDGLDAMRVVARVGARLLRGGGLVCAEHAEVQTESAPAVFVAEGAWAQVRDHVDLNRRPRFITAVRR